MQNKIFHSIGCYLICFSSIFPLLFLSQQANATHIAGADISYEYVPGSGNLDFIVRVAFYRDCAGVGAPFPSLQVNVASALCSQNFNIVLPRISFSEIIPYCPASMPTQCAGGANPSRQQHLYETTVTLPALCTDWILSYSDGNRNNAITTINAPGGEAIYVQATLNNTIFPCSSSPFFSNPPAPFVYVGQPYCYNNAAVDLDGDSLVYSLITPMTSNATTVTYILPYTATQPLTSVPPMTLNTATGDLCMTPTMNEITVLALLVQEYRFGFLIGTTMRDIQVNTITGTDLLPTTDGINSTGIYSDTIPEGCNYTFTTATADADIAQNLTLTSNVLAAIPGATFMSSGGSRPTGTFNWIPGPADVSNIPHVFVTRLRDDACPVNGEEYKAWELTVIEYSAAFTSSAPACVNQPVNFYSQYDYTGYNYSWQFGSGAIATFSMSISRNPVGVVYATPGAKTVILTITSPAGCSTNYTSIITINPSPTASFTSTAPQNECAAVDFTNTGSTGAGTTHFWNFGSGALPSMSTAENPSGIIYSSSGSKTITHLITNNFGCVTTTTVSITINPSPSPTFTSTAPQCEGSVVNFTNTGVSGAGINYFWDFGTGASPATSTIENPTGIVYSTAGTKTITLTVTNGGLCTRATTNTITINQTPVASFTSTAPQCTGLPVTFTNTGTSGATYAWNFGIGAAPATSTLQNPLAVVYSTAGPKTVTLISTIGTCTATSTEIITINQTPNVSFTSTAPQCAGSAVNFTNTGSTGINWSYSWNFGQNALPSTASAENPTGIIYQNGGTKNITFTISDQNCTNTYTASITINNAPLADAGKDTVICNNVTVQIGSTAVAGNTYSWFPPSTLNPSNIATPVASPIAPTTIYIVTVTNANGCTSTDSAVVTMLAPLSALAGSDGEICRYDSVQVGTGLITGQTYTWSPTAGLSNSTSPNPVSSPAATTTYTLSVRGPGCGPVTDEVTVIVHQLPIVDAGPNDTITIGASTQLTATGGIQYNWLPSFALSNSGIYNPIASPSITTTYTVTATDVFGCVNIDSVTVVVVPASFWVPSAFTPDGNSENDVLYVRGEGIMDFQFAIFNRWGEQVFYSKEIKLGWDGTRQGTDQQVPEGAYAYFVKGVLTSGTAVDEKGLVNLIR